MTLQNIGNHSHSDTAPQEMWLLSSTAVTTSNVTDCLLLNTMSCSNSELHFFVSVIPLWIIKNLVRGYFIQHNTFTKIQETCTEHVFRLPPDDIIRANMKFIQMNFNYSSV
jgi:hypothetical protein